MVLSSFWFKNILMHVKKSIYHQAILDVMWKFENGKNVDTDIESINLRKTNQYQ